MKFSSFPVKGLHRLGRSRSHLGRDCKTIKTEGVRCRVFATRAEANLALFEYIDGFYNSRRIQERLGFLSPIEFEEKYYAEHATAEPLNLKPRQPALTS
ncbi:IS3 family transposase [Streptomyces sp. NPDC102274]|uniref:IS3 family transposase n=1 Tax=Streptomyces sp. NPDC102274 TaxID=3366151 RepID=UPI0038155276